MKILVEFILGFVFKCLMTILTVPVLWGCFLFAIIYWKEKYIDYVDVLLQDIWKNKK